MFSRLRILTLALWLGTALAGVAQDAPPEPPRDQVYRVQRNGREVFTNAGSVQVGGAPIEALTLPQLRADLASASPYELQVLDNSVQRAHDDLQQGARCQAIRASLKLPKLSLLLHGHLRELCVGAGLLVLAVVMMVAWRGPLRSLMPVAPVLGCLYLGYATYARIDARVGALREGLRACSSDLPPQSGGVQSVRDRLEQASSLQATIDRAYALRASAAEAAFREAGR